MLTCNRCGGESESSWRLGKTLLAFIFALTTYFCSVNPSSARHRHYAHWHARHWTHMHFRRHARRTHFAHVAYNDGAGDPRGWTQPLDLHPMLAVAQQYLGLRKFTGKPGPWCRDFVNVVARRAGYRLANNSRRAVDALHLGQRVANPRPGDLIVMRHHVSIFAGYGKRGLVGLGGNQGHGKVTYSSYPARRVLAFVRL